MLRIPTLVGCDRAIRPLTLFFSFWLLLLCFVNPRLENSMALSMLDLATSIVDRQSFALDQYTGESMQREGRYYTVEPPGPAVFAAGIYAVLHPLFALVPPRDELPLLGFLCTLLVIVPAEAATAALLYRRLLADGHPAARALGWAALFLFGTFHFFLASGFYKEALGTFFLFAAYDLLSRSSQSASSRRDALAGLCAGAAIWMMSILIFPVALLPWSQPAPRPIARLMRFFACVALALVPLLFYHAAVTGHPLIVPYALLSYGRPDFAYVMPSPIFLFTMLLGPRGGFLLYQPILLLLVLAGCLRLRAFIAIARCRGFGLLAFASIIPVFMVWQAPWEPLNPTIAHVGLRNFSPTIPLLFLMLPDVARLFPARTVAAFGLGAIATAFLFAQAGLVPGSVLPGLYVIKVFATTLGAVPLFSEGLPHLAEFATLRSAVAGREVTDALLISPDGWSRILPLLLVQLGLALASLALVLTAAYGAMKFLGIRLERS